MNKMSQPILKHDGVKLVNMDVPVNLYYTTEHKTYHAAVILNHKSYTASDAASYDGAIAALKIDIISDLSLKEKLDLRICDCEAADNTQTYREFIVESETAFGMQHSDLDTMGDTELVQYLEFLGSLWDK